MRILLDTHIFLWFISGDTQLSTDIRDAIREPDNGIYLIAVSVWEAIALQTVQKQFIKRQLTDNDAKALDRGVRVVVPGQIPPDSFEHPY